MQSLPDPYGHKAFREHHVFDTRAKEVPFYATSWVQPVVHPMLPCGDFSGSSWSVISVEEGLGRSAWRWGHRLMPFLAPVHAEAMHSLQRLCM
ncbi:hypothetical protein WJX79_006738 [Trebouxia sp. C0005]